MDQQFGNIPYFANEVTFAFSELQKDKKAIHSANTTLLTKTIQELTQKQKEQQKGNKLKQKLVPLKIRVKQEPTPLIVLEYKVDVVDQ